MKKYRYSMLAMLTLVTLTLTVKPTFCETMRASQYYTWGIGGDELNIPEGSIVTEAVLTLVNIANWDNNLHIHLVDNPPLGFIENIDNGPEDFFRDFGSLLTTDSFEIINGNAVVSFSRINDEKSWAWDVYEAPFDFLLADSSVISFSSSLLELIDYAGNSTPFGIAFDPESNDYTFENVSLELTIESFQEQTPTITQTFHMLIPTSNHAPIIDSTGDKTVSENQLLAFTVNATDPDNDPVTITAGNLPEGAIFANGQFIWTPNYDQAGTYTISVTADDGHPTGNTATEQITVTVIDSPVITHIIITGPDQLSTNTAEQYVCTAWFDNGSTSVVSPSWSTNSASFAIDNLGLLTTPDIHGTALYTITAQHDQHQATQTVTVSCNNNAPSLTPLRTKTVNEGKTLTFTIAATDSDGDMLTFKATDLPENAAFDSELQRFQWKPSFTQAGQYQVTFTASDNCLTAAQTVTIIVTERSIGRKNK